jgi:dTMP kinase
MDELLMFIVFEGIDGSGTETWSKYTVKFLNEKGYKTSWFEFPDYKSPWGKIIRSFLNNEVELSTETQFLTYATDIFKDTNSIKKEINEKYVIADRYVISTMAYQCARNFSEKTALDFFKILNFPKPDYIILLLTSIDESMRRKIGEHGKLDRHEKDRDLLEKVTNNYLKYAKEKYFSDKWIIINANADLEHVEKEIVGFLNSILD